MNDSPSNIEVIRKRKKLSQARLAQLAGVSQATISRIEKSEQEVSIKALAKIAHALGVELTEIAAPDALNLEAALHDGFFAFCPNPFCETNTRKWENGGPVVAFTSGAQYASGDWPDINFCRSCGEELIKECPSCDLRLRQHSNFCPRCGKKLTKRPTKQEWDRLKEQLAPANDFDDDIPF